MPSRSPFPWRRRLPDDVPLREPSPELAERLRFVTLEEYAARYGVVFVPVSLEFAERLEREPSDEPVLIRLHRDASHPLLREMVLTRVETR